MVDLETETGCTIRFIIKLTFVTSRNDDSFMSLEIAVNGCYVHVIDEHNDRHTGDLGNIEEASDGTIVTSLTDNYISLEVQSPYSIVGRAVVVSV